MPLPAQPRRRRRTRSPSTARMSRRNRSRKAARRSPWTPARSSKAGPRTSRLIGSPTPQRPGRRSPAGPASTRRRALLLRMLASLTAVDDPAQEPAASPAPTAQAPRRPAQLSKSKAAPSPAAAAAALAAGKSAAAERMVAADVDAAAAAGPEGGGKVAAGSKRRSSSDGSQGVSRKRGRSEDAKGAAAPDHKPKGACWSRPLLPADVCTPSGCGACLGSCHCHRALSHHMPTATRQRAGVSTARTSSPEHAPAARNELPDTAAGAQRLDTGPRTDARAAPSPPPPASAVDPVQPAPHHAGKATADDGSTAVPVSMGAGIVLSDRAVNPHARSNKIMLGVMEIALKANSLLLQQVCRVFVLRKRSSSNKFLLAHLYACLECISACRSALRQGTSQRRRQG